MIYFPCFVFLLLHTPQKHLFPKFRNTSTHVFVESKKEMNYNTTMFFSGTKKEVGNVMSSAVSHSKFI